MMHDDVKDACNLIFLSRLSTRRVSKRLWGGSLNIQIDEGTWKTRFWSSLVI